VRGEGCGPLPELGRVGSESSAGNHPAFANEVFTAGHEQ